MNGAQKRDLEIGRHYLKCCNEVAAEYYVI
jgi:hypothetical protein